MIQGIILGSSSHKKRFRHLQHHKQKRSLSSFTRSNALSPFEFFQQSVVLNRFQHNRLALVHLAKHCSCIYIVTVFNSRRIDVLVSIVVSLSGSENPSPSSSDSGVSSIIPSQSLSLRSGFLVHQIGILVIVVAIPIEF